MIDYNTVHDFGNLYEAFRRTRKGKRNKKSTAKFEVNVLEAIIYLQYQLKQGTYRLNPYNEFYVYEPKERRIMSNSFKDKVVQHSLCDNVIMPIMVPKFIHDNTANQKGKGTHFTLDRLTKQLRRHYINHGTKGYILKCDISKYFDSMDHKAIKSNTNPHMPDDKTHWLWNMIINSVPDPMTPMGNLSSQTIALTYLDPVDQMIKRELGIKGYVRYVDDFVLIHEDKEYLQYCKRRIEQKLKELKIEFNPKSDIFPIKNGVDFLGFHTYLTDSGKVIKKLRRKSKVEVRRKLRYMKEKLASQEVEIENIIQSYTSWRGHADYGDCYYLIREMDKYFYELFSEEIKGINTKSLKEIRKNIRKE